MAESILNENMEKVQTESNLSIINNDMNIELSKEFLEELQMNAYHEWTDEDVMDHIAKIDKEEGKITVWEELVKKFFCKFYPESYDGEEEMLDKGENWGNDPLEFISRVNSSFDKDMKMVEKRMDDNILNSNNTTTNSFFKPYLIT
ncbi:hypothetical protein Tco_0901758 [Tanacetum coccineum]